MQTKIVTLVTSNPCYYGMLCLGVTTNGGPSLPQTLSPGATTTGQSPSGTNGGLNSSITGQSTSGTNGGQSEDIQHNSMSLYALYSGLFNMHF